MTIELEKINNYFERAKLILRAQYRKQPNIENYLKILCEQFQNLENIVFDLLKKRYISTSEGKQLDGCGEIVGEERFGRNDDDYRAAITVRALINRCGGESESIISTAKGYFKANKVEIINFGEIRSFYIYINSGLFFPNIRKIIESVVAAGVGHPTILYSDSEKVATVKDLIIVNNLLEVQSGQFYNDVISQLEVEMLPSFKYNLEISNLSLEEDGIDDGFAEVILHQFTLELHDGSDYDVGDGSLLELKMKNANEYYSYSEEGGILAEVII